jgi:hypothetical protein
LDEEITKIKLETGEVVVEQKQPIYEGLYLDTKVAPLASAVNKTVIAVNSRLQIGEGVLEKASYEIAQEIGI